MSKHNNSVLYRVVTNSYSSSLSRTSKCPQTRHSLKKFFASSFFAQPPFHRGYKQETQIIEFPIKRAPAPIKWTFHIKAIFNNCSEPACFCGPEARGPQGVHPSAHRRRMEALPENQRARVGSHCPRHRSYFETRGHGVPTLFPGCCALLRQRHSARRQQMPPYLRPCFALRVDRKVDARDDRVAANAERNAGMDQ